MTFANEKELFDFLAPLNAAYAALPVAMPFRAVDPDVCEDCAGTGKESRVEWVSGCERDFEAPCCTCAGVGRHEPVTPGDRL
jgi:hypothetical protein